MSRYQKLLYYWGLFWLVFIPLYPKFPLFQVPDTYVAVRLEDFIVLISLLLCLPLIKTLILNQNYRLRLIYPLGFYLLTGLVSLAKAVLIYQITPVHLSLLHYLRRIEYWVPLIFFSLIPINTKRLKTILITIFTTTLIIDIYALGQKLWQWPVISTMNEEFSKGITLRLSWLARVNSTFAGHYDLAIFLVMILMLSLGFYLSFIKTKVAKTAFWVWWFLSFYILVLTASRISIATFFASLPFILLVKKRLQLFTWIIIISMIISLQSKNLNQRFISLLPPAWQTKLTFFSAQVKTAPDKIINLKLSFKHPPSLTYISPTPQPAPAQPTPTPKTKPISTTQSSLSPPPPKIASRPAQPKQASQSAVVTASPSAVTKPFPTPEPIAAAAARSSQIRFAVEWPRAIRAFKKNPLIGTGYASLGLATDNDYLRLLGEIGLVGLIAFGFIWLNLILMISSKIKENLVLGYIAALVSFMLAAVFIDAFESSKIAYYLWALTGIFISYSRNFNLKSS